MTTTIQDFGKRMDFKVHPVEKLPHLKPEQRDKLDELSLLIHSPMYKIQAAQILAKHSSISIERAERGIAVMCERGYLMEQGNIVFRSVV